MKPCILFYLGMIVGILPTAHTINQTSLVDNDPFIDDHKKNVYRVNFLLQFDEVLLPKIR